MYNDVRHFLPKEKKIKKIYFSLGDECNKRGEKVVRHYQIYNQCVEHECSRNHFYGWVITYEKMKQYVKTDLSDGDKFILDTAKYVLENDEFKYYVGTSYRHLTIWDKGEVVSLTPPHDILGKTIGEYLPTESKLKEMMKKIQAA